MTGKSYLNYRLGLRKRADGILSTMTNTVKGAVVDPITENAKDAWGLTLPLAGILTAYLIHKATTPKAVADNAPEYAANAMERESLAESLRDLQDAKAAAKFKRNRSRVHDQFV